MSRHWKPESKVVEGPWTRAESYARKTRRSWPAGATAGVALVAAACLGVVVGLYEAAGPRQAVDPAAIEWNEVQAVPMRAPDAADVAWERRAGEREAASGGTTVSGQHIYVIDGDTFDLNGTRIRVAGIDAPETHPSRCPDEARLGAAATQKLAELLRGRPLRISGLKTDRYGRSVGTVRVAGEDVADAMISAGLARNYDGKQRQGWC